MSGDEIRGDSGSVIDGDMMSSGAPTAAKRKAKNSSWNESGPKLCANHWRTKQSRGADVVEGKESRSQRSMSSYKLRIVVARYSRKNTGIHSNTRWASIRRAAEEPQG